MGLELRQPHFFIRTSTLYSTQTRHQALDSGKPLFIKFSWSHKGKNIVFLFFYLFKYYLLFKGEIKYCFLHVGCPKSHQK